MFATQHLVRIYLISSVQNIVQILKIYYVYKQAIEAPRLAPPNTTYFRTF